MNRREALCGVVGGVLGVGAANSVLGVESVVAPKSRDEAIKLLTEVRQGQAYTDEPVPEEDILKIVQIGCNAPSGHNVQPWFFSVVTNRELLAQIDKAAKVGPGRLSVSGGALVIFVCCEPTDIGRYDAGAAGDRMNVAANLLGYGCKTVMTAPRAANEKEFKEKLEKEKLSGFEKLKGNLVWPANGKILKKYGDSRAGELKWMGLLIRSKNQQVKAIAKGDIVLATELSGYGFIIAIDHGDGYISLYGNNRDNLKKVGDRVYAGELIAYTDSDSYQLDGALYFEIRHKGKSVNPSKWLRKRK